MSILDLFSNDDGTDDKDEDVEAEADSDTESESEPRPDPDDVPDVDKTEASYTQDDIAVSKEEAGELDIAEFDIPEGRVLDDIVRLHKRFIAPTNFDAKPEMARSGVQWVQSMYVNEWPQHGKSGFLEALFSNAKFNTDVSIHIEPRDRERAKNELDDRISSLANEYEDLKKKDAARSRDVKRQKQSAQQMYDLVSQQDKTMFDVSLYMNHRAPTPDALLDAREDVRGLLERPPANTDTRVASRLQDKAMVSASPIADDALEKKNNMMSGAVAATMPFSSATMIEEGGVDFGVQPYNGSPVIIDRFNRDTGYNMLVIGEIGSGKSFSTKLNLIRTMMYRDDVELIMLDPLEGFVGVSEALDAERVVVGGDRAINPLEIQETPQHILDSADDDLDPYSSKLRDVMAFFDTFFSLRNNPLKERRGVLEMAIQQSYNDKEITRNPNTHHRESPTIQDVIDNLKDIAENPSKHSISEADIEADERSKYASQLLMDLQPFREGGEYENLSKPTDIDINDRITYLDLQQEEGRSQGTGLMMQLLFNAVYERVKQSDGKTIFVMDEARYLMRDAENLEFLEQAVRHSRHYDLSIQFVTQTADEFFSREASKTIADNCSLIQLNKIEGLSDEVARDHLGLNERQAEFVRNAQPGDEELDYSEALLGVDGKGWMPIHIKASDLEAEVVDFEPDEDDVEDLPGKDKASNTRAKQFRKALETRVQKQNLEEAAEKELSELSKDELKDLLVSGDFSQLNLDELAEEGRQSTAVVNDDGEVKSSSTGEQMSGSSSWSDNEQVDDAARLYHVRIAVDDAEAGDGMPVIEELDDAFTVFGTDPPEIALRANEYDIGFDAIVASNIEQEEISRALAELPEVEQAVVTDINDAVDWNADEAIDVEDLQQASGQQDEVEDVFKELKQEFDIASFEEIRDEIEELEFTEYDGENEITFGELVGDEDDFDFDTDE